MSRNGFSLLALLVISVFSAQGMQLKKIKNIKPLSFIKLNDKAFKYEAKEFHTSKPIVNIKSVDKVDLVKKQGKMLSVMAKMKPKAYYFNTKDSKVAENGIGGAWLGFVAGQSLVYGVWSATLYGVQVGGDLIFPGAGSVTSATMAYVLTPLIITPTANVAGIAGGIAGGTATGPL